MQSMTMIVNLQCSEGLNRVKVSEGIVCVLSVDHHVEGRGTACLYLTGQRAIAAGPHGNH